MSPQVVPTHTLERDIRPPTLISITDAGSWQSRLRTKIESFRERDTAHRGRLSEGILTMKVRTGNIVDSVLDRLSGLSADSLKKDTIKVVIDGDKKMHTHSYYTRKVTRTSCVIT